ncbi:MAG: ion transporter [bacterium]
MKKIRYRIFEIIEIGNEKDYTSKIYDVFLLLIIALSLIPLLFKETNTFIRVIEIVAFYVFVIDFLLRFFTCDFKLNKGAKSFFLYFFTFSAIFDFCALLPSFTIAHPSLKILKTFRFFRCLRVFKTLRFSKNFTLLITVVKNQQTSLMSILTLCIMYIFFTAIIMFNIEPTSFDTFFDSLYWSVTALTTVGYGDIYPISDAGKVVSMLSSLFGIAMVALPSAVITAGFQEEIKNKKIDINNDN